MAVNPSDAGTPAERLRGMLGGKPSAPQSETVPEPAARIAIQVPRRDETPLRREEPMLSEAAPVVRQAPMQAPWDSEVSDAEKIRVLEGFHQWVVAKIDRARSTSDTAVDLRQVMNEIVGAAGLVSTLLSSKR